MKIVLYDVESRPNICYTWGLWDQNLSIDKIKEPGRVISWAAKELGSKKTDYADETMKGGHEAMVRGLHKLLSEADGVCTYNGVSFDNKMMAAEYVKYGLAPLPPTKQIDLLKTVKKHFRFPSNKLDYVSGALGIGQKVKHEGFGLWIGCMENDPKAWAKLKKYNIGDVILLEKLYNRLKGWIVGHPSHSVEQEAHVCPNCGGKKLQHRGFATTKTCRYARLQCTACGSWSREKVNEVHPDNRKGILVGL